MKTPWRRIQKWTKILANGHFYIVDKNDVQYLTYCMSFLNNYQNYENLKPRLLFWNMKKSINELKAHEIALCRHLIVLNRPQRIMIHVSMLIGPQKWIKRSA